MNGPLCRLVSKNGLAKVDWSRRDVLIGTFRSRNQFDICLKNKFYYIPAERVKDDNLPIHYVAMFQTPRIFSNEAGIYYYGEVLRTARVRRSSIPVTMTHGNPEDLYYRFVIREWIPLTRPILPKESGFVHAYTNTFLLENVEFVPELLLRSEEEYRFYMELKRRTGHTLEEKMADDEPGFEIGTMKVLFEDGKIIVIRGGNIVTEYSINEFSRYPNASFRRIGRAMQRQDDR